MFIDFTAANKILTVSHLTQHDFQITKQKRTKNYYKCFGIDVQRKHKSQTRIKRSSHQVSSPAPVIKSKQRSPNRRLWRQQLTIVCGIGKNVKNNQTTLHEFNSINNKI